MKHTRSTGVRLTVALIAFGCTACLSPETEIEGLESTSAALLRGDTVGLTQPGDADTGPTLIALDPDPDDPGDPGPDDPEPPRDPLVPRHSGLRTLRVNVARINATLPVVLTGTRVSIDGTHTAPPLSDPSEGTWTNCTRDDASYEAARQECLALYRGRVACIRALREEYPITCHEVPYPHHSYLAFTPSLKAQYPQLTDYLFDSPPFRKDTRVGEIEVTLNRLHTTFEPGNLSIYGGNTLYGQPYLALRANVYSGQPTAICRHLSDVLGCPDIELRNMVLTIRLEALRPNVQEPSRIGFGEAGVLFAFDRNINNVPDFLVTPFFDIDARIRLRTKEKIQEALRAPERKEAIEKALNKIITLYAQTSQPEWTGFAAIDEVLYHAGELIIHYRPL